MSRSAKRSIKSYSIWIKGQPDGSIPDRRLGAYVGMNFVDACKRACWDRFGVDYTASCFHVNKSGIPFYSGHMLYNGRK